MKIVDIRTTALSYPCDPPYGSAGGMQVRRGAPHDARHGRAVALFRRHGRGDARPRHGLHHRRGLCRHVARLGRQGRAVFAQRVGAGFSFPCNRRKAVERIRVHSCGRGGD